MDAKALLLYRSDLEILRHTMTEEDRANLYLALEKWCFGEQDYYAPNEFAFQTLATKIKQAEERYMQCVANGKKGGRPKQNQTETKTKPEYKPEQNLNETRVKPEDKPEQNLNKNNINNNIKNNKEINKESRALALECLSEFNRFWDTYGKKVGRPNAYRAFMRARLEKDWSGIEAVLDAVRRWNATEDWQKDGGRFKPHPATWLNRQGWLDEVVTTEAAPAPAEPFQPTTITYPLINI